MVLLIVGWSVPLRAQSTVADLYEERTMVIGEDTLTCSFRSLRQLNVPASAGWAIDRFENQYVAENGNITKYDSTGTIKFSQSVKSLGNMTALAPVNAMKLVHFSEEQQTLCYFDNTLTKTDDCIDLGDRGIAYATKITESGQPNKLWVYDNLNSTLKLMSIDGTGQEQAIQNLKGLFQKGEVLKILERNNRLYILFTQGIVVLDIYGVLIEQFPLSEVAVSFDVLDDKILVLGKTNMLIFSERWETPGSVLLPLTGLTDIAVVNRSVFLRDAQNVHKFALQIW